MKNWKTFFFNGVLFASLILYNNCQGPSSSNPNDPIYKIQDTVTGNPLHIDFSIKSIPTDKRPVGAVTADFDGDGRLDIAVGNSGADNVEIFRGLGEGEFATLAKIELTRGSGLTSLVNGDFDNDGITDLAVLEAGSRRISLLKGIRHAQFMVASHMELGSTAKPVAMVTADFDLDGFNDLATLHADGEIRILANAGQHQFRVKALGRISLEPQVRFFSLAVGDLDNSGFAGIAVSTSHGLFALSNKTGTLGAPYRIWRAEPTSVAIVEDFNADGFTDIAAIHPDGRMTWLGGRKRGFEGLHTYNTRSPGVYAATEIKTALSDFAFLSSEDNAVITWGFERRTPQVHKNIGTNPVAILSGDFSGDGTPDLCVVNSGSDSLTIFVNTTQY